MDLTRRAALLAFAGTAATTIASTVRRYRPGQPWMRAPISTATGVQLRWYAPRTAGSSPITGYNVYIDGKRV